jgi:hypothetical protein
MSPKLKKKILHAESRRNARKAFLALSGAKDDEDQDQSAENPSLDKAVVGSVEEIPVSGNTPVSRMSVFCFIAWAYFLVIHLVTGLYFLVWFFITSVLLMSFFFHFFVILSDIKISCGAFVFPT